MKRQAFSQQLDPFRKRIRDLRKDFRRTFKHHMVDDDTPPRRKVTEGQAEKLDAILDALESAVENL